MKGVFTCTNPRCAAPLGVDHVILLTTMHMRRFCSVECIAESQDAHHEQLAAEAMREVREVQP